MTASVINTPWNVPKVGCYYGYLLPNRQYSRGHQLINRNRPVDLSGALSRLWGISVDMLCVRFHRSPRAASRLHLLCSINAKFWLSAARYTSKSHGDLLWSNYRKLIVFITAFSGVTSMYKCVAHFFPKITLNIAGRNNTSRNSHNRLVRWAAGDRLLETVTPPTSHKSKELL